MHIRKLAIRVNQQFNPFFVTTFTARELLKITYSEPLIKENNKLTGHQRLIDEKRRKSIQKYINSTDCAFPNSIILAANFTKDGSGRVEEDKALRWEVVIEDSIYYLEIPTDTSMAVIIDGQHRISGFKGANSRMKDMELVCSVYLDLPSSLQAFLFATINSNQKPVNKSQAYELFGYDLENESPKTWSPDKLAISLCRKLNSDQDSPFYQHIKPGASINEDFVSEQKWQVSTACIVDRILGLITSDSISDKSTLYNFGDDNRLRCKLLEDVRKDNSALRRLYIDNYDGVIYNIICNFFKAASFIYNEAFENKTALTKTIGIQGLFDVLNKYILHFNEIPLEEIDFTEKTFKDIFLKSQNVQFDNDIFMKFSGVGRSRVRDAILVAAGFKNANDIKSEDFKEWITKNLAI